MAKNKVEIKDVGSLMVGDSGHVFVGVAEQFAPTRAGVNEEWVGDFAQVRGGTERIAVLFKLEPGEWDMSAVIDGEGNIAEIKAVKHVESAVIEDEVEVLG